MSFIKKNIPNAITCGNLLCGCLAIVNALEGNLVWAAYLVGIAAVLDFFDGFAARMLKVSSPIGKDLDSLADMVTFGVVPGVVMFQMFNDSIGYFGIHTGYIYNTHEHPLFALWPFLQYLRYIVFLIPIFSAVRLAKFNNDTRQSDSFIGVPTPANAILICSLGLIAALSNIEADKLLLLAKENISSTGGFEKVPYIDIETVPNGSITTYILNPFILTALSLIMSFLLVAELPLIALKFKHFKWKGNEIRFIFLGGAVVLLASLQLAGIPLVIVFYILISIINNILTKQKAKLS